MNEFNPPDVSRRHWLQAATIAASLPALAWGRSVPAPVASENEDDDDEVSDKKYQTKIETEFIGDKTNFSGMEPVVLEGVGLVRGLSGTGGDPAPSHYRSLLMAHLRRIGYKKPNAILQSPDTALVIVRAYLTPMVKKGAHLDVEVRIPESAEATSLVGGELMEVYLSDKAIIAGELKNGRTYAIARGPVLTAGLASASSTEPALLKRGRVLGGATVILERDLYLTLKNDFRSIRNSARVADAVGRRFHHFDEHGIKKPLATAKTDQRLTLAVHPRYKDNMPRYLDVIRHMSFREEPVQLRVRMAKLQHELMIPQSAGSSALQLEAIGTESIPILKKGIISPMLECRFHSAVALAYLGDSSGLSALIESAKKERAFRVFALAAIATLEDAEAHLALRELMNEPVDESRYGAFRALWTLDKNDPFIRGERLGIREDADNHDSEFNLHVLRTSGPPLVHVTLRTRPEIVVFGAEQEFQAPMYVSAGKHVMVTALPGATTISLARFEVSKPDQRKEVSLRVADVIRAADELGANYPDILQMLTDASKQKNLAVPVAADKLPEAARVYYRPQEDTVNGKKRAVKIGRNRFSPGSFPEVEDPDEAAHRKEDAAREAESEKTTGSMANVPDEQAVTAWDRQQDQASTKKKTMSSRKNDRTKSNWSWFAKK